MDTRISRRGLGAAIVGGALLGGAEFAASAQEPERDYPAPKFQPKLTKPRLSQTLIQDFVLFAHYDLDSCKLLLQKEPSVINATIDWGAGDWESGLGGASHMGRRDIVELLLSKGARMDIFCATMLGHLDVVKQMLTTHPEMINAKGPHGMTLAFHAKAGKKQSEEVLKYLEGLTVKS